MFFRTNKHASSTQLPYFLLSLELRFRNFTSWSMPLVSAFCHAHHSTGAMLGLEAMSIRPDVCDAGTE